MEERLSFNDKVKVKLIKLIINNGIIYYKGSEGFQIEESNIDCYNLIGSEIDDNDALKKLLEQDKGEEYQHNNYYSHDDYWYKTLVDIKKKFVDGHLFSTTTDEVYSRYKFINDKKCWHELKYLKAIKMKKIIFNSNKKFR
jgi:hypothetical protein